MLLTLFQLGSCVPLTYFQLGGFVGLVFFDRNLSFWHCKVLWAHLVYLRPQSQNQPFLQGPLTPSIGEWYEKTGLEQDGLTAADTRPSQLAEQGNISMCTHTHVRTHTQKYVYI